MNLTETSRKIQFFLRRILFALVFAGLVFAAALPMKVRASSPVETAVQWAVSICANNVHGYSQANRWGPDYDCSSLMIAAYRRAGFSLRSAVACSTMRAAFVKEGFIWIPASRLGMSSYAPTNNAPATLQRGDILLDENRHTEMYLGSNMTAAAHSDRGYPRTGDQTGTEVSVSRYYNNYSGIHWDGVLRYVGKGNAASSAVNGSTNASSQTASASRTIGKVVIKDWTYTGEPKLQTVTVYSKTGARLSSSYYTRWYTRTLDAGKGYLTITGRNGYTGRTTVSYKILPAGADKLTVSSLAAQTYTGSPIVPSPTINYGKITLKKGRDYDLSAVNLTGQGTLTIRLKGNYTGTIKRNFTIKKANISSFSPRLAQTSVAVTGQPVKPAVTIPGLKEGVDYTCTYKNNVQPGTASVIVAGKGQVTGSVTLTFRLIQPDAIGTVRVKSRTYDGTSVKQPVTVYSAEGKLLSKKYYTVSYSGDLKNAGTVQVTVKGRAGYVGTQKTAYSVKPKSAAKASTSAISARTYTGETIVPSVSVKLGKKSLKKGTDYTTAAVNEGTKGTLTVTFRGNYTGKVSRSFTIRKAKLSSFQPMLAAKSVEYSGEEQEPEISSGSLQEGRDYTATYQNNVNAGSAKVTVTGKSMVTGSKTMSFTITPKQLKEIKAPDVSYDGTAKEPEVTGPNGETITGDRTYSNNVNAGRASVTVKGTGNYTGSATAYFTILPRKIMAGTVRVTGIRDLKYTGKPLTQKGVKVYYKDPVTGKESPASFRIQYVKDRKNVGTQYLDLVGTGNYQGSLRCQYRILPSAPHFQALWFGSGKICMIYSKVPGRVYYEVCYQKVGAKGWKSRKFPDAKSQTIYHLEHGKYYRVKVRAYYNGAFSSWSNSYKIRVR